MAILVINFASQLSFLSLLTFLVISYGCLSFSSPTICLSLPRCMEQGMVLEVAWASGEQTLWPPPPCWSPSNMCSSRRWQSTLEASTAWPCLLRERSTPGERLKMESWVMATGGKDWMEGFTWRQNVDTCKVARWLPVQKVCPVWRPLGFYRGRGWLGRGGGGGVITRKKNKEECFLYFFPLALFSFHILACCLYHTLSFFGSNSWLMK